MTETKYIFPKQPQFMAILAFITVLIALLLVLIVMEHMRNRNLKVYWKNRWRKDNFWIRCLQIPRLPIMLNYGDFLLIKTGCFRLTLFSDFLLTLTY